MRRALILLTYCTCALALNPELDISQYAHTAWKIRDGFPKGIIYSIAQTPDGYLWLGTELGLLRFDGVKNVAWQSLSDQHLPGNAITSLLAARDGSLWIGTLKGLASWKGGKLTQYSELAGQIVFRLLEDREGSVWVGVGGLPTGKLCVIQKGSVGCYGQGGSVGRGANGLYEDAKGNVWVGVANGLWRWKPGPPQFYSLPDEPGGISNFGEADDGALLISTRSGIRRFVDGKTSPYLLPDTLGKFRATGLLRDRDGGLWIKTSDRGLLHVHRGRTDVFARPDGLSGDYVGTLFEDREGDIWATTAVGLDRFRDFAAQTFSGNQGFSNAIFSAVLAARDGSVWFSTVNGLDRWNHGKMSIYREQRLSQGEPPRTGVRKIVGSGLPDRGVLSLFEDDRGRIWVSTTRGFGYLENDQYVSIGDFPAGIVRSIAQDTGGNLWISNLDLGLFRLSPDNQVEQIPWSRLGRQDFATALAADPVRGGLWLGFYQGGVVYFKDGKVRASHAFADRLGDGWVTGLRLDPDGALWAATNVGLSRVKDGRVATLTRKNGLPCDALHWVVEDDERSFWFSTPCGLVRVARDDLEMWAADHNRAIKATVFDSSDGVRVRGMGGGYTPFAAKSTDGKVWFGTDDGVSVIDPRHLPFNKLPPPVHIEQLIADRKTYNADARLSLPPLTRDLQIDYTALSLVAPERVRFRYMLEGRDRDWQDASNRRQAFYSDLSPRNYRFRVMATNNSGVWNAAGASFDFSVAPAYYQTTWFLASVVAAVLVLLTAAYRLRLRYLKHQFDIRLEARVGERTRIARDLHDTLLQSFQGVLLNFSTLQYMIPNRPTEALESLERMLDQARAAITEGRDALQELRSSTLVANDLARAIHSFGEGLAADHAGQNCPEFHVQVEGKSRDLPPLVRDEVYQTACECLRNAFRHAQAKRIEVEFRYDPRQFRLRVVDNGKGIDPAVLSAGGRAGHHGLPGINERAELAGGKLSVWSRPNSGTEIELTIPASIAYIESPAARRSGSSGKGAG